MDIIATTLWIIIALMCIAAARIDAVSLKFDTRSGSTVVLRGVSSYISYRDLMHFDNAIQIALIARRPVGRVRVEPLVSNTRYMYDGVNQLMSAKYPTLTTLETLDWVDWRDVVESENPLSDR